jgi:hypothetical protein
VCHQITKADQPRQAGVFACWFGRRGALAGRLQKDSRRAACEAAGLLGALSDKGCLADPMGASASRMKKSSAPDNFPEFFFLRERKIKKQTIAIVCSTYCAYWHRDPNSY